MSLRSKFGTLSPRTVEIDGPWRVGVYTARISPFRTYTGVARMMLAIHSASAIFGSGEEADSAVLRSLALAGKQKESIRMATNVDISEAFGGKLLRGNVDTIAGATQEDKLQSLIDYRDAVLQAYAESGTIFGSNKRYDLIYFDLTLLELSDENVDVLLDLIKTSAEARMNFLFRSGHPDDLPIELESELTWEAFLGVSLSGWAEREYSLPVRGSSVGLVNIGVLLDKLNFQSHLMAIQSSRITQSAHRVKTNAAIAEESDNYLDYLSTLIDEE